MNPRHVKRLCSHLALVAAIAALALAGATATAAQYQWRDAHGRMVYSDLPPPSTVEPSRILRAPEVPQAATPAASGVAPVAAARDKLPATNDARLSIADREMAYRKRAAEAAEEQKKASETSRRKLELAQACSDAQGDIRSLESGQRISRINAAGEREYLSDAERAGRLQAARKSVGERC